MPLPAVIKLQDSSEVAKRPLDAYILSGIGAENLDAFKTHYESFSSRSKTWGV